MRKITLILALLFTMCTGMSAQENLIQGGDFDRAGWQDSSKPDLWKFDNVKVNHLEAPSYEGNKGYCYVDITPKAGGKMRNYREDDNMLPDFACMKATAGAQLKVVFWAKSENANTVQISTPWYDADKVSNDAWTSADIKVEGGVWKKYTVYTAAAPDAITGAGLSVLFTSTNGNIAFDDFAVYAADGAEAAGTVIVELEDGTIEGGDAPQPEVEKETLIQGGDFDRAGWQDYSKPDLWKFDNVKVSHLEEPSYKGNQGYCYVDITPSVDGTMRNYRENDNMQPDFACMTVSPAQQLEVVFWTRSAEANTIRIAIPWYDAAGNVLSTWTSADIKVEGGVWKKYTVYTEASPAEAAKAGLSTLFTSANGNIAFDDFAVYAADGTQTPGTVLIELEDGSQQPGEGEGGGESVNGNLFKYGDFEQVNPLNSKPMGWYLPNSAYFKFEKNSLPAETKGKQALCIYPNTDVRMMTNFEGKENILAVEGGRKYALFFYAKADSELDKTSVRFQFFGNDEQVGEPLYVAQDVSFTGDWQLYTYEFTTPWEVNSASCTVSFSTDNAFIYLDDFQLYLLPDEGGEAVTPIPGVVRVDNLFYLIEGDHAVVSPEADQDGINYNEANRPSGDIVIPATIEVEGVTYPVTRIADSAFDGCPAVSSVKMPAGITRIGNYAFQDCSGLETIACAESLTDIGFYAFYQCSALRSLSLPAGLRTIGDYAFGECTALESFEMNATDPASITTGKELFFHVDRDVVVLKVPAGTEDLYANLYPWSSFKKIQTGIRNVASAQAQVSWAGGQLTVQAQQPVHIAVYDLSGQTVYAARVQQAAVTLGKGVYVLKVGNETRKVVLN